MKKLLALLIVLIILFGAAYVCIAYYGYVFAKTIQGQIIKVERVTQPDVMVGGPNQISPMQMYSFAIAIKSADGEIHTASSEDRQWAVAQAGQCVVAKFFPYPPWELDKAGTYHGARLVQLFDCPKGK